MTEKQEEWLVTELMDSMKLSEGEEGTARRYIRRAVKQILIYCNRKDLPEDLQDTAVQIAEDMMTADGVRESGKDVASVTRGDTSITYRDESVSRQSAVVFMKNYERTLNHFRKMNLPKDGGSDDGSGHSGSHL